MKWTVTTFLEAKLNKKKVTMLTAYDYATARLVDSCDIDGILVGDSLGMVCLQHLQHAESHGGRIYDLFQLLY